LNGSRRLVVAEGAEGADAAVGAAETVAAFCKERCLGTLATRSSHTISEVFMKQPIKCACTDAMEFALLQKDSTTESKRQQWALKQQQGKRLGLLRGLFEAHAEGTAAYVQVMPKGYVQDEKGQDEISDSDLAVVEAEGAKDKKAVHDKKVSGLQV
jgi:hypothetical protein